MKKQTSKKLEIFLLFALRQSAKSILPIDVSPVDENDEAANGEKNAAAETEQRQAEKRERAADEARGNFFTVFSEQLSAPNAERFERLRLDYENKSDTERQKWRARVEDAIGEDELTIDENVHWSHVEAALQRETALIRKIVAPALLAVHKDRIEQSPPAKANDKQQARLPRSSAAVTTRLEKIVRRAFAAQFVGAQNLPIAGTFDRLSGANLARLARLAGIREAAFACAGIESVETVGAFLRRFAPEHARAIAAQLSALPQVSVERLGFAENLVRAALEAEPNQPSAMLDWLGLRLIAILLCAQKPERIAYTEQKLPLAAAPSLSEIIAAQCRETPDDLRREIGTEIERLAGTIANAGVKNK